MIALRPLAARTGRHQIFNRRVTRKTPGRFRTRVNTEGVIPSLHVDYKSSRIKEYFKEGRALRVETTINDTRAFRIGKRLKNLPALRKIGFAANRRLLDVQRSSHDCDVGEDAWTYDLRRLRLHGLIERIPRTHRFRVTPQGLRIAIFFSRTWARLLRPGLSLIAPPAPENHSALRRAFQALEAEIARFADKQKVAA